MKAIAWILGIIILVVVGVGAYLVLYSGDLIKSAIEELGPDYLGARVSVDAVDLSLTEGSAGVRGLRVGNPQGYGGGDAMRVGLARVVLDTSQISETLVVMKEVVVDGADLAAIARGKKTNFQQLVDNITASTGGGAEPAPADSGPEMKFIVDRLAFTNATASLSSDVLGDVALDIPDINLAGVGRRTGGVTAVELAEQILKPISSAITREVVAQGLDLEGVKANVKQQINEKLEEKLGSGLRSLTDRLKKRD